MSGRSSHNVTVNFDGAAEAGMIVPVMIDAATSTTLAGHRVAVPQPTGAA
jgi:hypothetical protein